MDEWQSLGCNSQEVAEALFRVTGGDKRKLRSHATDAKDAVWGQAAAKLFPKRNITERDRVNLFMIWRDDRKNIRNEYDQLAGRRTRANIRGKSGDTGNNLCVCEKTDQQLPRTPRIFCNQCNKYLHYACAEVNDETDLKDFVCGYCTGELTVPPMFEKTNNEEDKPLEKRKAYTCGTSRDFSDDDNFNSDSSDSDMSIDSETSESGLDIQKPNTSPKTEHSYRGSSKHLDFLSKTQTFEEPSPAYSPISQCSTRHGRIPSGTMKQSFENPNASVPSSLAHNRNSYSTENSRSFNKKDSFSDLEQISSDDDDGVWATQPTHKVLERKHSANDNKDSFQEVPGPEKKGSRVSWLESTFLDIEDIKNENEDKDNVSDIEIPVKKEEISDSTKFHDPETLFLDDDDEFEDFNPPLKHSTPYHSKGHKGKNCKQDLEAEPKTVFNTETKHTKKRKKERKTRKRSRQSKDIEPLNESHSNDSSQEESRPNWEDPNFDKGEKLDTSKVPRTFKIKIPYGDWRKILTQKPSTTGRFKQDFCLVKNYMDVIRNHFSRYNPFCIPTQVHTVINRPFPSRPNASFLRIRAECNRDPCQTTWYFNVDKKPVESSDVIMHARHIDDITHYKKMVGRVKWNGEKQKKGREKVVDTYPYTAHAQAYDIADPELLDAGNYSEVPKLTAWQQMRAKKLAENDLDKEVYHDIAKSKWDLQEKFPDDDVPGYIQCHSGDPAKFILFTKKQMNILQALQSQDETVTLQLDATGCLVKSLPWPWDTSTLLFYTVIMRSASKKIHMPLTEMLTSDHTIENVSSWLVEYFKCFQKQCKVKAPHFGIQKLEVDFSKVLIQSAIKVLANCTLDEYIVNFWYRLTGGEFVESRLFPIHVCRVHVVRAIRQKLKSIFGKGEPTKEYKIMILWTQRFVLGRTMKSFQRRLQDAGMLCGFRYLTDAVQKRIESINDPTNKNVPDLFHAVKVDTTASLPFYRRSPFGTMADMIFQLCEKKSAECVAKNPNLPENPFYSPDFLHYLKQHVTPYYPIVSHCVLDCTNSNYLEDTTNPIEQYHGLLKNNVHKYARNQKASRFLRRQADFINGLCKQAEEKLGIQSVSTSSINMTTISNDGSNDDSIQNQEDSKKTHESDGINLEPDWSSLGKMIPTTSAGKGYKSPQKEKEVFKKPFKRAASSTYDAFTTIIPLVPWGREYVTSEIRVKLYNTCSIDTTLQILVGLYRQYLPFGKFLSARSEFDAISAAVKKTVEALIDNDVNAAKTTWIYEVLKIDVAGKSVNGHLNCEASEERNGYGKLQEWMQLQRYVICCNKRCSQFVNLDKKDWNKSVFVKTQVIDTKEVQEFEPEHMLRRLNETTDYTLHCPVCHQKLSQRLKILGNPCFFFYILESYYDKDFPETRLPLTQKIQNKTYKVFAYTIIRGQKGPTYGDNKRPGIPHFSTVFIHEKKRVVFDGLMDKPYISSKTNPDWKVTSVWLIPET
ncbi:unnamed protein product [Orchesella dallaii]|uniref:Uncharacterized protein n=1 Tax=Orchesella dallaii TaxID=48710 RepID=A0ABP1Q3U3_9HEXA